MTITRRSWIIFSVLGAASIVIWYFSAYPQFAFLNFSIDRSQASRIAASYLQDAYGIDPREYRSATVFSGRHEADRYLQRALGFQQQLEFLNTHQFELFFWKTRFFKENAVEQFFVTVSTSTGEVTSVNRHIPDTEYRPDPGREQAKVSAAKFLRERFGFDPDPHTMTADLATAYDHRVDYTFAWVHNDVQIPWGGKDGKNGAARIQTKITLSGDDILYFTKDSLIIPEEFTRSMRRIHTIGRNFGALFRLIFLALLFASVFSVISRKNSLLLNTLKMPAVLITLFLFTIDMIFSINGLEYILFDYPTTSSMLSYFWRFFSNAALTSFTATITFLSVFLAGELLHYEAFPSKRHHTFLHHIQSTFLSRNTARLIVFGYLASAVMLGLQSLLFSIGERHLGVWTEYRWMSPSSASFFPFIPAFVIAISASLSEEAMFRMFGISLGKKVLRNTFLAVLISSVIWGYGHSGYPVYPMWFRGLEVSCLGILLSIIYLKYGLIPVLTAHYLFDAFWCSANFLFRTASTEMFYSSVFILIWPLAFALLAFIKNKPEIQSPMKWKLTKDQAYNLKILKHYLAEHPVPTGKTRQDYMEEIRKHGWDTAVVETAFLDIK